MREVKQIIISAIISSVISMAIINHEIIAMVVTEKMEAIREILSKKNK